MANRQRGEVSLPVGKETYKFSFSVNSMCELEDAMGQPLMAVVGELQAMGSDLSKMRVTLVRQIIWAALQDHHPKLTLKEAGQIASDAGLGAVMQAVGEAINLAFPAEEGGRAENPPEKPAAGR